MPRSYVGREVDDFVKTFLAAKKSVREDQTDEARQAWYNAKALNEQQKRKLAEMYSDPEWQAKFFSQFNAQPAGASGSPVTSAPGDLDSRVANTLPIIAQMETGGQKNPYATVVGLTHKNGKADQALGRYGILASNVPEWSRQHLGRAYSIDEFLKDEKAQDAIAAGEIGKYYKMGHSPREVAAMWIGGPKGLANHAADKFGSTPASYADRAMKKGLGRVSSAVPMPETQSYAEADIPEEEQFAADGGMIAPHGEAAPEAPAPEVPLETALDGALRAIQQTYNLKGQAAAIPGADEEHQQNVAAMSSNDRAVSPEAMQALIEHAGSTDEALRQIYSHFASQGDERAAGEAAMGVVQAARQRSMELGQHAMQALHQGDIRGAADALIRAYDEVPDGNKATGEVNEQGVGKAVVTNGAGKVIDELPLNPQTLAMLADKFSSGAEYYGQLARYARPAGAPAQGAPQQAVKAFEDGGFNDPYLAPAAGILASDDGERDTFSSDMAVDAADERAQLASNSEAAAETPSAVPTGGGAGAPPPIIPTLPGMPRELVKHIETLNRQRQWDYQHNRSAVDLEKRSTLTQDRADARATKSREASDARAAQKIEASKAAQENAIKAHREDAETAYYRTPAGKAEKEEQGALRASAMSDVTMGAPVSYRGELNDADRAVMRELDLGARAAPGGSKGYTRINSEYSTDEDTPNKTGSSEPYAKAVDLVLSERPTVENNQRSDGSKGTDPYAKPLYKLSDPEKSAMTGLITSIGVRNPTVPPEAIARAVLAVSYNTNTKDWGVDPKSKMFYVRGEPGKPSIKFAMSGSEYEQLVGVRRDTDMLAKAQAQIAAKKQQEGLAKQKASAAEVQKRTALRVGAVEQSKKNQTPWIEKQIRKPEPVAGESTPRGFLYDQLYGTNR